MNKIVLLACLIFSAACYGQRPAATIRAKVDYLHDCGDSVEVWLKRQHPYRATRQTYFSAMLPKPLPDSLRLGAYVSLYLGGKRGGQCAIPFKIMPKNKRN